MPHDTLILQKLLPLAAIGFSLAMLAACCLNRSLSGWKKAGWIIGILVTVPFFQLGALAYGFTYFAGRLKAVPAVAALVLLVYYSYMFTHIDDFMTPQVSLLSASNSLSALPKEASHKEQLQQDINTMRKELADHGLTQAQEAAYSQLGLYMMAMLRSPVTNEEFNAWRALFFQRFTIPAEDVAKLVQSRTKLQKNEKETP